MAEVSVRGDGAAPVSASEPGASATTASEPSTSGAVAEQPIGLDLLYDCLFLPDTSAQPTTTPRSRRSSQLV